MNPAHPLTTNALSPQTESRVIYLAHCNQPRYDEPLPRESAPELPGGEATGPAQVLFRRLLADAALDREHSGTKDWNPLSQLIRPGEKVLIKPNWVHHRNYSGAGLDCLVTHREVIAAVLHYVISAHPARITIGDAPIQGCDFADLAAGLHLRDLADRFPAGNIAFEDFRRTKRAGDGFAAKRLTSGRQEDAYVEFDLGQTSWLEPVTRDDTEFRVTMYDPDALKGTHRPAAHRYLVARDVIDADVVLNLPKLKTHKRAGITGALKNVVGIVGAKDYLPHHRKGSSENGGDCYLRSSVLKSAAEASFDAANRRGRIRWLSAACGTAAKVAARIDELCGGDRNVEGSWYGNDTLWRMVLDLQRVLYFGRLDGSLADSPMRRVLHITDAIVAGGGEGPLSPNAVPLGVMTMAGDAAAAEWVHALIMGFDPNRIPLLRNARRGFPEDGSDVSICWGERRIGCEELLEHEWPRFAAPRGWRGHCELLESQVC